MNQRLSLPNWITLTRFLGAPFLLWSLQDPEPISRWISLGVFLGVSLTDWLDGYVARRLNQVTDLGKILDPLVDKLLVMAPLLALVARDEIPAGGVFVILARELTIAGWRSNQAQVQGANNWGKLKTVVQILAIALLIAPLSSRGETIAQILFWVAVVLTIVSGLIYLSPVSRQEENNPKDRGLNNL